MPEGSLPLVCERRPGVVETYWYNEMVCPIPRSFWRSAINWSGTPIVCDDVGVWWVNHAILQDAHNGGVQDEIVWLVPIRIDAELAPGRNKAWTCWNPQFPNFQCYFSYSFWADERFWLCSSTKDVETSWLVNASKAIFVSALFLLDSIERLMLLWYPNWSDIWPGSVKVFPFEFMKKEQLDFLKIILAGQTNLCRLVECSMHMSQL